MRVPRTRPPRPWTTPWRGTMSRMPAPPPPPPRPVADDRAWVAVAAAAAASADFLEGVGLIDGSKRGEIILYLVGLHCICLYRRKRRRWSLSFITILLLECGCALRRRERRELMRAA